MLTETGGDVNAYNLSTMFSPAKEVYEAGKVLAGFIHDEHNWMYVAGNYPIPKDVENALKVFDGKDTKSCD